MLFVNTVTLADYNHFMEHMQNDSRRLDPELKCKSHVPLRLPVQCIYSVMHVGNEYDFLGTNMIL